MAGAVRHEWERFGCTLDVFSMILVISFDCFLNYFVNDFRTVLRPETREHTNNTQRTLAEKPEKIQRTRREHTENTAESTQRTHPDDT